MATEDSSSGSSREDLIYGGVCPVCGEEFTDGAKIVDEYVGESVDIKMCITEGIEGGDGSALMHLPEGLDGE